MHVAYRAGIVCMRVCAYMREKGDMRKKKISPQRINMDMPFFALYGHIVIKVDTLYLFLIKVSVRG